MKIFKFPVSDFSKKSGSGRKQDALLIKSPSHAVPFSDEWLAAIEAAGEVTFFLLGVHVHTRSQIHHCFCHLFAAFYNIVDLFWILLYTTLKVPRNEFAKLELCLLGQDGHINQ